MASGSYSILQAKYQRALVTIRELEQSSENYRKAYEELQASNKQIDKSTRYLCETILKKDPEIKKQEGNGTDNRSSNKEDVWFRKSTLQIVELAQASLEGYFPRQQKNIEALLRQNKERTKEITGLQKDLQDANERHDAELRKLMKKQEETISNIEKQVKEGERNKHTDAAIKKQIDSAKRAVSVSETKGRLDQGMPEEAVDFTVESDDTDMILDEAGNMMNGDEFRKEKSRHEIEGAGKVNFDKASKEKIRDKVAKLDRGFSDEISEYIAAIGENHKKLIIEMGKTGKSEIKSYEPPISSQHYFRTLSEGSSSNKKVVLERESAPALPSTTRNLYRLNDFGRAVYKELTGKDAVESEADMIKRHHGTLEHGYGIRDTANLMKEMKFIKKSKAEVIFYTRGIKEYKVKVDETHSFIPDIVVTRKTTSGDTKTDYYEYETGKCTEEDFYNKCFKIASCCKNVNIIVKDHDVEKKYEDYVTRWFDKLKETRNFPRNDEIYVRIITYNGLYSQKNGDGIEWTNIKRLTVPKKK